LKRDKPTQQTIANLLGIDHDTVRKALAKLEEAGFIERETDNGFAGKFDNTVYKVKFAPDLSDEEPKRKITVPKKPALRKIYYSRMIHLLRMTHHHQMAQLDNLKITVFCRCYKWLIHTSKDMWKRENTILLKLFGFCQTGGSLASTIHVSKNAR
jgi:hypothetical protein